MTPTSTVNLWMPWYIKDHRARAGTLSHIEHSVLTYLQMHFWENDGTIADDDRSIAREVKLTVKQWLTMRPLMLRDCVISGGRITSPQIVAEVQKARTNIDQKRKAGRASAAARAAQRDGNGCSTAVATAVQPRAGGGGGEGISTQGLPSQELGKGEGNARESFRVIGGGK